ncbi:hypothetical protein RM863_36250 [Streptomyces sp. DSM 41014]|uniref:Uncharacterized protein n=1 Tax=Streptomyces hintoniae TaxID=3075521 RepID=A0ABU2UWB0_9ACTN|nr:hypothetical protein [Streptomyces sp. DSM 41014]MDT0477587.1 hypothetical protein [Streptomyces sp. DSM 41014]
MTARHRPPDALRRTVTAAAAGALAPAGAIALPAPASRAATTARGDVIANLWGSPPPATRPGPPR